MKRTTETAHRRWCSLLVLVALLSSCVTAPKLGTREVSLQVDGVERGYWLHLPTTPRTGSSPLVVLFPDSSDSGLDMLARTGFAEHADQESYVVAALDDVRGDDLDYVYAVLDNAAAKARDLSQTLLVGYGTGASAALAVVQRSELTVDALAVVAGQPTFDIAPLNRPVPSLFIFGDSDPLNPLAGGMVTASNGQRIERPPPSMTAKRWARSMGCRTTVSARIKVVKHTGRHGCRDNARVVYLEVEGLGHYWPRGNLDLEPAGETPGASSDGLGPKQPRVDATTIIWEFFNR